MLLEVVHTYKQYYLKMPLFVPHASHNMPTVNCNLCSKAERNGAHRITKVNFGETVMQTLELLWLDKR